ncbi:MAG: hypothetical protein A4E28_00150 [Methanocella sp. PtaU1.Bin125]|nr:MAG: hypothetical protein A4E28_00150 [Methanocella sp. PtaU1.Bin125]
MAIMIAFCSLTLPASSDSTPIGMSRSRPMSMMCRTRVPPPVTTRIWWRFESCPIVSASGMTAGRP